MGWSNGDWVVRREVLTEGPWLGMWVRIVEDSPDYLVSYIPEGSPFGFPEGNWPTPDATHPWSDRLGWQGHGCLMIQRPGDAYAVWHFWTGSNRQFTNWYINLQEPFRRTSIGYDTQDLELDFLVYPDDRWEFKDDELLDQRVEEGRWNKMRAVEIRAQAASIAARLQRGERWWPLHWRDWSPESDWVAPSALPAGWESIRPDGTNDGEIRCRA